MRNVAIGCSFGASTKMPHSPKMIDGTAASRSTITLNGRASRFGAYWVRNTAIPIETGTASASAKTELSTVTMNRVADSEAQVTGVVGVEFRAQ